MALDVYTWGGSDILALTFQTVSAVFRNKAFQNGGFLYIAIAIGLAGAIWKAVSSLSIAPLLKRFLLPVFLTLSLFTVGSQKVVIHDKLGLKNQPQTTEVSHVPSLVAYTAHFFSSLAYYGTKLFEGVVHGADDPAYNKTGKIYGAALLLSDSSDRILDGDTKRNFQNFCHHCVRHDIGLGLYSMRELEKEKDLMSFLEKRTSRLRKTTYRLTKQDIVHLQKAPTDSIPETGWYEGEVKTLPCNQVAHNVRVNVGNNIVAAKEFIQNSFTSDYQKLQKLTKHHDLLGHLVQQKIAIDMFKNHTWSVGKGLAQQIETQKTAGIMNMTNIIALRSYLETLFYMMFPLIIIISLFYGGLEVIKAWIFLIGWLTLWPPCYIFAWGALDFIWQTKGKALGLAGEPLTVFVSNGYAQLAHSMEGIAFWTFTSIPLLSYAILQFSKGVSHGMAHWVGGLGGVAQSTAAAAAAESVSGNYSLKNTSIGNENFANKTSNQVNRAAFYRGGMLTSENAQGVTSSDSFGDESRYKEHISNLSAGFMSTNSIQESASKNFREAESKTGSYSKLYAEDLRDNLSRAEGMNLHASQNENMGASWNNSEGQNMQSLLQEVDQKATDFANTYGTTKQGAYGEAMKAGLGFNVLKTGLHGDVSLSKTYSNMNQDQAAERISSAKSLQSSYGKLSNQILDNREAVLKEEGGREYVDWAKSTQKTISNGHQLNDAFTKQKSWEHASSLIENSSAQISRNMTDDMLKEMQKNGKTLPEAVEIAKSDTMERKMYEAKVMNKSLKSFYDEGQKDYLQKEGLKFKQDFDPLPKNLASKEKALEKPEPFKGQSSLWSNLPESSNRAEPPLQEKAPPQERKVTHYTDLFYPDPNSFGGDKNRQRREFFGTSIPEEKFLEMEKEVEEGSLVAKADNTLAGKVSNRAVQRWKEIPKPFRYREGFQKMGNFMNRVLRGKTDKTNKTKPE